MGNKGMSLELKSFAEDNYSNSKSDLFAMFIERNLEMATQHGFVGMITMQSWMFLGSYTHLREVLFSKHYLVQMLHTGPGIFPDLGSFNVLTTCFVFCKSLLKLNHPTYFVRANKNPNQEDKINSIKDSSVKFLISIDSLRKIPDFPLVYWLSRSAIQNFSRFDLLGNICPPRQGLATADNDQFVRFWYEVSLSSIAFGLSNTLEASQSKKKWFPYNKGGNYRKWYGNNDVVVNWSNDG